MKKTENTFISSSFGERELAIRPLSSIKELKTKSF